jgi:uroporphyrinogen decarboxylase
MVAGQGSREQAEARRWPMPIPGKFARSSSGSRRSRSIICRARSRPAPRRCNCSTAGREAWRRRVRALGDRADRADRRAALKAAPSGRSGHRLSQGRRRQARAYARETGVDAIGLDETVDPAWAARELPEGLPVQGNLDPLALIAGGER